MRTLSHRRGILLSIYSSSRAAIDLASIMVGIIVIGLIGGVIAATIFVVIPWAQDNAAKASIAAVKTAESAYRGFSAEKKAPGLYGDKAQLVNYDPDNPNFDSAGAISQTGGLLQDSSSLIVAAAVDSNGEPCYAVASRSGSGRTFYATDKKQSPTEDPQTTAGCVLLDDSMFPGDGNTPGGDGSDGTTPGGDNPGDGTTPPGSGAETPASDFAGHVPFQTNVQAATTDSNFDISGYNTAPSNDIFTNLTDENGNPKYSSKSPDKKQLSWYPVEGGDITVYYRNADTDKYVPFMTRQDNYDSSKGAVIDTMMVYDTSNTFWAWFGDSSPQDAQTYADEFKKMSTDGGAVKYEAADQQGKASGVIVTASWEPIEGNNPSPSPTDTPPGWGTGPTISDTGGSNQDECGPIDSGGYGTNYYKTDWSQKLSVPNCTYTLSSNHVYDDRYQQEPNNLLKSSDLGEATSSGYTTYQKDTRYGPQYNGYFKPSAARGWTAKNGTDVTVEYKDADGNYNNMMTVTQNSNYSNVWAYGDSHTGGDMQYYDQSSSYDSSKPYVDLSIEQYMGQPNVSYDQYYSNSPQSCVTDFFADTYKNLYYDGNGEQHCDDVREFVSLDDSTDYTNKNMVDKMKVMSEFGGRITFTTTAGNTVTVVVNPGDWRHTQDQDPGTAT